MLGILKPETLLPILYGRRVLVFLVFFLVAAVGTSLNLLIPKQFTGSAAVLLDTKTAHFAPQIPVNEGSEQRFLREQVALLSSYNMVLRVVETLNLDKSTEARQMYSADGEPKSNASEAQLKHWLADSLQKKVQIRSASDSNVVDVEFTSPDPRLAAAVANAFVQAYIKTVADNQSNSSKRQIQFVQRQLADLREGINSVEKTIYELQQREEYFGLNDRFELEGKRLRDLSARLVNTSATSDALVTQLRSEYDAQKIKVTQINALRTKLKVQQSNLDAMQRSHDFAMQRFWQESLNERPDAFSIVNLRKAVVPEVASLPKLWINLPLCFLIGLIAAVATALVAELADRRIRTEASASELLDLPILATVAL